MSESSDLNKVKNYFAEKLNEHGATHRGVDYNSTESQEARFFQLLKVMDTILGDLSNVQLIEPLVRAGRPLCRGWAGHHQRPDEDEQQHCRPLVQAGHTVSAVRELPAHR
jgi:hypothetical protein